MGGGARSVAAIEQGGACDCATAEELLEKLSSLHAYWQPNPSAWIFRGISDAKHELKAKAHRANEFAAFNLSCAATADLSARDHNTQTLLDRFRSALDRAGLPIPALAPEPSPRGFRSHGFIDRTYFPSMALAQHLGIPTPLLDWTSQARVAAYFAAEQAARSKGEDRLAVWAMRRDLVNLSVGTGLADETGTEQMTRALLTYEVAPRASNPNLHAQSGLFTWLHGEKAHAMRLEEYVELLPQERTAELEKTGVVLPLMRRLSAPQSCAPKLLRLLSYDGIDGSSMFPGYDGVVRSLRERVLWDKPEEEKR
jgi:hypothetical protein